jgi:hypothetical protein
MLVRYSFKTARLVEVGGLYDLGSLSYANGFSVG